MSPLIVHFLRRLALFAAIASAALVIVPKLLVEFGLVGPGVEGAVESAASALAAARTYGARPEQATYHQAELALQEARTLQSQGRDREARHAAGRALHAAIAAQRDALLRHAQMRQQARVIYDDLEQQEIDLEKLYDRASPGWDKPRTAQMLALMKATRQTAGALFLDYEQEDYDGVIESEAKVREAVSRMAEALRQARRR